MCKPVWRGVKGRLDVQTPSDGKSPFRRWVDLASRREPYSENVQAALELNVLAEAANVSVQ
jgi:hypothetical protein